LANIYVATPPATVTIATVDAVAADKPVKAGLDCFCGGNGFNEYPDLDHVACLPVIARGGKPGRDNHPGVIFVEDVAVHKRPPIHSARAGMAIRRAKPIRQSGPWKRGWMRSFMD
jgi:hypothetical protein